MKTSETIFSVEKSEDSTGFLLWQVTNLWQREIKKALEEFNLTHSQFVILASTLWLSNNKNNSTWYINQVLLSNHTKIDPMTTSTVLRTLQNKWLINRTENKKDTRAKTIGLTNSGKEIAKLAIKKIEKFDENFFKILDNEQWDFNKKLWLLLTK